MSARIPAQPGLPRRRPRRGFLLVEVIVCVALTGVVVYLSGSLVEVILKAYAPEAPAVSRSVELAVRSLRRDAAFSVAIVRPGGPRDGASGAAAGEPARAAWSQGPLVLTQAGASVRYELSQGVLSRTVTPAGGRPVTRVVGRGLTHFRFRVREGVLGVEVGAGGSARKGRRAAPQIEDAWMALRGGKDGRSW